MSETGPGDAFISDAQAILDRFHGQFARLMKIHHRLAEVRGSIVATPSPSSLTDRPEPPGERPVAFFAGLSMIAAADEVVIAAIERDVEDLAKLF